MEKLQSARCVGCEVESETTAEHHWPHTCAPGSGFRKWDPPLLKPGAMQIPGLRERVLRAAELEKARRPRLG